MEATPPRQLFSIALEVTSRCNQRCRYCYNPDRHEPTKGQTLDRALIERLLGQIGNGIEIERVTLTGGEPFSRPDIHELIDLINDKGIAVAIISNGGLITKETAARLAEQNVAGVQLTLTGHDAESHDALCGSGTFSRAMAALELLGDAGIRSIGSYLCNAHNYATGGAILDRFAAMGVSSVAFNRFNPAGDSRAALDALMPTRSQVAEALTQVNAAVSSHDGTEVTCTMPIPECVFDWSDYPNITFGACSAGTAQGELAVAPDGGVKLCTMQRRTVGTIADQTLLEILDGDGLIRWRRQIPEFCRECPNAESCLGGCGAAAEWVFGAPDQLDPFLAQHVDPDYEDKVKALRTGRP